MPWRSHQREALAAADAIAAGASVREILAAVTPGGGKSALPVILAARLLPAGLCTRVCWVVPRDTLRRQAEEAFLDPRFRALLGHGLSVRAGHNAEAEPWRGHQGWVTTYQAVAAAPARHLAHLRAAPTLLVLDEAHHLPALGSAALGNTAFGEVDAEEAAWSAAVAPLLGAAAFRLLLSGTLERADGQRILGLPYRAGRVDLAAPGWAVLGYSRRRALAERAVLPVRFGALDGEASWREGEGGAACGPHRLAAPHTTAATRPALFAALRTGFAHALLARALEETRLIRAARREAGLASPGKLLVVAADQAAARQALAWLRAGLGARRAHLAALATSDERDAAGTLARFRLAAEPACLVTVAMAHEGMDAPAVAVLAALTHIRSPAWLEQMVARATRVDPGAGPWEAQRATVFHPDDPLFAAFRLRMEREQGRVPGRAVGPLHGGGPPAGTPRRPALVPLGSRALGLRWSAWRPGPAAPRGLGPAAPRGLGPAAPRGLGPAAAGGLRCIAPGGLEPAALRGAERVDAGDVRRAAPGGLGRTPPGGLEPAEPPSAERVAAGDVGRTLPGGLGRAASGGLGRAASGCSGRAASGGSGRAAPEGLADEPPSVREASLRRRLARLIAAQVLEDGAEGHLRGGGSLAHAYNAALKRALGGRSGMGEPELEAACEWLGRHRLSDHLHLLEGDARFAWALRRRGVSAPGFFGAEVPGKP